MESLVTGYFSAPFWCYIPYCMGIAHSTTSSFHEHLGVPTFLARTNNATVNNLTQDYVWMYVFSLLGFLL